MTEPKEVLKQANAAITQGDYEGFLSFCTEDTQWNFVGDTILQGKEAVRQWMAQTYLEPPQLLVFELLAEGNVVVARGNIAVKDPSGEWIHSEYCDVWRFHNGQMAELHAYVIEGNPVKIYKSFE